MIIETKPVGPFALNVYIVGCPVTGEGVIIDAGGDQPWVEERVDARGLRVGAFLQTHGHIDHVAGLAAAKARWSSAPIALHPGDRTLYDGVVAQGALFGVPITPPPPPERALGDGDVVEVGELRFEVLATPGHTPGHVVFYERTHGVLFSGDLLFAGSIGRTDLPGGDYPTIVRSLARVCELPGETRVYSGHGPSTTIGEELASNPFLDGMG